MFSRSNSPAMKFICVTLLIISGITDSRSEQYEVVGPADVVPAVAGEDVILPCSVKPNISVVDMRVEWFRSDLKNSQLVHLYDDHEDRNTDQSQSYRGRTKLNHQELQRGNASLKLSSVRVSDEGLYKCFIQSKSWYDDATVNVSVEERDQHLEHLKTLIPKVNVILDADTAHPQLIVSDDGKQVSSGNRQTKGVDGNKDRFNEDLGVAGKDGFSSGCFYFEVQVKGQTKWELGVTRESVNKKDLIFLRPENGYWIVGRRNKKYRARDTELLSLSVNPQRVGVFVNYEKGLVCFNDVESMSHIYTYTDQSFNEKLYPFVSLGCYQNDNSTPLIICDDY
ncbi:butyrophilin subfamily 1 member A1-like isoform X2 [Labeo rohita]|uniref:Butyrophilin subfamily 1 member A1-like isoform X2 n=1 Tax=Labeo rohita TaxID=84645 RepID=A0A498NI06_LABRO|nr:butyrophilin subfamily 1 member A1-like isoform X2 [Labeo rohita]